MRCMQIFINFLQNLGTLYLEPGLVWKLRRSAICTLHFAATTVSEEVCQFHLFLAKQWSNQQENKLITNAHKSFVVLSTVADFCQPSGFFFYIILKLEIVIFGKCTGSACGQTTVVFQQTKIRIYMKRSPRRNWYCGDYVDKIT